MRKVHPQNRIVYLVTNMSQKRLLLEAPQMLVDLQDNEGCTPFFLACYQGFPEVARLLAPYSRVRLQLQIKLIDQRCQPNQNISSTVMTMMEGQHCLLQQSVITWRSLICCLSLEPIPKSPIIQETPACIEPPKTS